ncbi:hypothetical protein FRC07_001969, partial [Ceratobasidium sp. 392]
KTSHIMSKLPNGHSAVITPEPQYIVEDKTTPIQCHDPCVMTGSGGLPHVA